MDDSVSSEKAPSASEIAEEKKGWGGGWGGWGSSAFSVLSGIQKAAAETADELARNVCVFYLTLLSVSVCLFDVDIEMILVKRK